MKKIVTIAAFCIATIAYAQERQPTLKAQGDLVKATYYYADGSIRTEGFFKNKKLTGEWIRYDKLGNKVQLAYYNDGKKVGKWFFWTKETLKEVNYSNNSIASVNIWKPESKVAINND